VRGRIGRMMSADRDHCSPTIPKSRPTTKIRRTDAFGHLEYPPSASHLSGVALGIERLNGSGFRAFRVSRRITVEARGRPKAGLSVHRASASLRELGDHRISVCDPSRDASWA
jgi:hypothetical protein